MKENGLGASQIRLESFGSDAPWDTLNRVVPNAELRIANLLSLWLGSLPQILLAELYNWPRRTVDVRKSGVMKLGARMGSLLEVPCARRRSYKHACMLHMQQSQLVYRSLRLLDVQLIFEAFESGAKWGLRNSCNESARGVPRSSESS